VAAEGATQPRRASRRLSDASAEVQEPAQGQGTTDAKLQRSTSSMPPGHGDDSAALLQTRASHGLRRHSLPAALNSVPRRSGSQSLSDELFQPLQDGLNKPPFGRLRRTTSACKECGHDGGIPFPSSASLGGKNMWDMGPVVGEQRLAATTAGEGYGFPGPNPAACDRYGAYGHSAPAATERSHFCCSRAADMAGHQPMSQHLSSHHTPSHHMLLPVSPFAVTRPDYSSDASLDEAIDPDMVQPLTVSCQSSANHL
jgi:hypothetical protein